MHAYAIRNEDPLFGKKRNPLPSRPSTRPSNPNPPRVESEEERERTRSQSIYLTLPCLLSSALPYPALPPSPSSGSPRPPTFWVLIDRMPQEPTVGI